MNTLTKNDVRSFLEERYAVALEACGITKGNLPDDFDFLSEGILDSLGIIELIAAMEVRFDRQIDFEDLDTDDLVVVGPFCEYVASRNGGGDGDC